MDKLKTIIFIFVAIIIVTSGYLAYRAEDVTETAVKQVPIANIAEMEDDYKVKMCGIYQELTPMLDSGQLEANKLADIKEQLLRITVPKKEYQELHINTFLIVNKFISENGNADQNEIDNAKSEIAKLKVKNSWISSN